MANTSTFEDTSGSRTYHACPICFSEIIHRVLSAKDFTVSQEKFEVWECSTCQGRFTQHIPTEEKIGSYYQSEDYISHTDSRKGIVNQLYQLVRNFTLGQKRRLVQKLSGKREGSILDIGCGTGDFLGMMKSSNWQTLGLEPDERARKIALEKNGIITQETSTLFELEENKYDLVSMWHVLEHVHELHAYLEQIKKVLKKDGSLIIAVPNFKSSDARHYHALWAAYDVPRHLYHFSPQSVEVLLGKHGFSLEKMKTMPFDSFYVSLLSEKYKHGKLRLIPGFWNGFVSYLNSVVSTENSSSVLYIARLDDRGSDIHQTKQG